MLKSRQSIFSTTTPLLSQMHTVVVSCMTKIGRIAPVERAYWSYLAGGYHTYGKTNTWNFSSSKPERTQNWKQALHSPGAKHLSVLTKFFASIDWWECVPDQAIFGSGETRNAAMRSSAGDGLLLHFSSPVTASVRLDAISAANTVQAMWIVPRTREFATTETPSFTTPKDWPDALLRTFPRTQNASTGKILTIARIRS